MKDYIIVLCENIEYFMNWARYDVQGVNKKINHTQPFVEVGNCRYIPFTSHMKEYKLWGWELHSYIYLSGSFDKEVMLVLQSKLRGKINE